MGDSRAIESARKSSSKMEAVLTNTHCECVHTTNSHRIHLSVISSLHHYKKAPWPFKIASQRGRNMKTEIYEGRSVGDLRSLENN